MNSVPMAGMSRARLTRLISKGSAVALALGVWVLLFPYPYGLVLSLCVLLPLVAIGLDIRARGALDFEARSRSRSLSIATLVLMPSLALFCRAILDLNFPAHWPLIALALAVAFAIWLAFFRLDERLRSNWRQLITVAMFALSYSYGALSFADSALDPAGGRDLPATILGMRVRVTGGVKGSSIWHEVAIDPRLSPTGKRWIAVSPQRYGTLETGEAACLHLGPGLFGVAWFDVRPCG